jgi:hypothetical protein
MKNVLVKIAIEKVILPIVFIVGLTIAPTFSQQNIPFRLSPQQALLLQSEIKPDSTYKISGDSLFYKNTVGSILQGVVLYNPSLKKSLVFRDCEYIFNFELAINKSYFKDLEDFPFEPECNNKSIKINFKQGFSISDSFFSKDMPIRNIKYTTRTGSANINQNYSQTISLDDNELNLLNLMNNTVDDQISVSYSTIQAAVIAFNKFNKSESELSVSYSSFKVGCSILENFARKTLISNDTINGVLNIHFTNPIGIASQKDKSRVVEIKNSLINSQCIFLSEDSLGRTKFTFENCAFGSTATILNFKADTLVFKNCTNIPHPLFLTGDPSKGNISIQLINSNVNNIRFDYTDKFQLYFDKDVSEETKSNTYQSLLAKYKAEGKPKNVEKIDIEFRRQEYKKKWWLYPIWLLDFVWWRYSYSKWLIIVWTLVFLGIFFQFNWRNWDGMRRIYGVFDKDDLSLLGQGHNPSRLRKKMIYVLLFTSFIFFSLRIDFDKLKYANNKYLVSFFTQYVVGLVCLFFLANAIFKIG